MSFARGFMTCGIGQEPTIAFSPTRDSGKSASVKLARFIFPFMVLWVLITASAVSAARLEISGRRFLLDGKPIPLWGIRVASAAMSEPLTNQLIANLDEYRAHGVNAVTVFYMGSLGAHGDPFTFDGKSVDTSTQRRMERIVAACDARQMVVIVGIFYQRAATPRLRDWGAAQEAVRTVTAALCPWHNLIINVANEQTSETYEEVPWRKVRDPDALLELCQIVKAADPSRLVGAGGYHVENNVRFGRSAHVDALLFDHNKPTPTPAELYARYASAGVQKPMINVELFGAWTREFRPAGVYPEEAKREHYRAIDETLRTEGLYLFFHSSPWCQASTEPGTTMRFDLGGNGTLHDRGIRWYFEYLKGKL